MKAKDFYNSPAWKWFSKYMKLKFCDDNFITKAF